MAEGGAPPQPSMTGQSQSCAPFAAFSALVERKSPDLPGYVVLPPEAVAPGWRKTFVALCALNGGAPFRRTVKPRGDGRWFVEFAEPHLRAAGVEVGDPVALALWAAPAYPSVLLAAVEAAGLTPQWAALTPAQRRALAEPVFEAKGAQTRETWVAKALWRLGGRW